MPLPFWPHLLIRKGDDVEGGDIPYDVGKILDKDAIGYVRLIEDLDTNHANL